LLIEHYGARRTVSDGLLPARRRSAGDRIDVVMAAHLQEPSIVETLLTDEDERSSWDEQKLASALKELSDIVLDFEIEATGFETPEIDLLVQSLDPPEAADAADAFEAPDGPPVSRPGDLWILGRHRLLCGTALSSHAYGVLMAGEKAAAACTDRHCHARLGLAISLAAR
jgi:hypothetical protein